MSVTFQGSKTLSNLLPDLQKSLDAAQKYLLGQDKDNELKDGLLGDLNNQITAFEKRVQDAAAKVQEVQNMIDKAQEITQGLADIVDSIGNSLGTAGVYSFTVTNELSGSLSGDLATAMSEAGIPDSSTVGGIVLLATDGGTLSAINNVIKLF